MAWERKWTIPNLLTVGRFLLVPFYVMAYARERMDVALAIFVIAGATDGLDGFLARVLSQRSRLGAILDPLADKTLLDTAYVCLALARIVPSWLSILVVSRDLFIIGGMAVLAFYGVEVKGSIRPSILSKLNTLAQMLLAVLAMAQAGLALEIMWTVDVLVPLVGCLTVLSGLHYIWRGYKLLPDGGGAT